MKRLTITACLSSALLLSSSCLQPPSRPGKMGGGTPRSSLDDTKQKDKPIGDDIGRGKTPDDYGANLRCDAAETHRGIRSWRRLSNIEMKNTINDIFGIADADLSQFPLDIPKKETFDTVNVEGNYVNASRFAGYENFSKSLAEKINLAKYFPCLGEGAPCMTKELPKVLEAAWRRPATADEVKDLATLFGDLTKDGMNAETSARVVIQAIVLSHNFLYRSEFGVLQDDNSFALTDWELASALSYTLLRRPPNEELRKLAAAGELSKPNAIRPIAEMMMNSPQAKDAWKDFAAQWLDTMKISQVTKPQMEFEAMKPKLVSEVRDFFTNVMFDAPAPTYKTLLTADYTIADPLLDPLYESKSAAGKTPFMQVERRGILGQAGFLASHSLPDQPNPILRGVFVAERVLCIHFLPPPPVTPPKPKPGLSNKELFRQHNNDACAGCHTTIDNLGFAFENFDAMGKFRTMDAGQPIVAEGKLPIDGKEIPITSPQGMFETIGTSTQGQQCFVREAFRYGFGRTEFYYRPVAGLSETKKLTAQGELDRCQIETATAKMIEKNGDLKTAIIELVSSPAFRLRLKGVPESDH